MLCPDAHVKIKALQQDINKWKLENKNLKCMKSKFRKFGCYVLTTDSKVKFFTGFKSKQIMDSVFGVLQKHSHGIRYRTNPKRAVVFGSKVRRRIHKANRVLTFKDELLMTFMRLGLRLLETDFGHSIRCIRSNSFTHYNNFDQIYCKLFPITNFCSTYKQIAPYFTEVLSNCSMQ